MLLKCEESGKLHPEGILPAVCVDVIDLGLQRQKYNGEERVVPRLRLVFETQEGEVRFLSRSFTASLHPKAKLAEVLGRWRGRAYGVGDQVDTDRLIGACCTLVVSHQQRADGTGLFASVDTISRPTKHLVPSGTYNAAEARARLAGRGTSDQSSVNSDRRGAGGEVRPAAAAAALAPAPRPARVEPMDPAGQGDDDIPF